MKRSRGNRSNRRNGHRALLQRAMTAGALAAAAITPEQMATLMQMARDISQHDRLAGRLCRRV